MHKDNFRVAVIQAAPVFLDLEATIEKACNLIREASKNGAAFVLLPEVFVPGYPDWIWNVPIGKMSLHQELYATLLENSISMDDKQIEKLAITAKENNIYVAIGVNEKNTTGSEGSIYNTVVYINADGTILGKHQKLIPTLAERTAWAYGDPSTLQVFDTDLTKIGGLICWENYMPLARCVLYSQGVQLYLAPTYDESDTWKATMSHIAREGGTYVLGSCMAYKKSDILTKFPELEPYYKDAGEWINSGNSVIVEPSGAIIAGPLHQEEGILYADINLKKVRGSKWNLDVAGHYSRPDVFHLSLQQYPETEKINQTKELTIEALEKDENNDI